MMGEFLLSRHGPVAYLVLDSDDDLITSFTVASMCVILTFLLLKLTGL